MFFGLLELAEARGGILAHSLNLSTRKLPKGTVLDSQTIDLLKQHGVHRVIVARLDSADIAENDAARSIADLLVHEGLQVAQIQRGCATIQCTAHGLVRLDAATINAINNLDESVAISTVPDLWAAKSGDSVATVKIITYGLSADTVNRAKALCQGSTPISLYRFNPVSIALLQTKFPNSLDKLIGKTEESVVSRIRAMNLTLSESTTCHHNARTVAAELSRLERNGCAIVIICGAQGTVDRSDIVPTALVRAGGAIVHFGLPVNPGHLTLIGNLNASKILVAPPTIRSGRPQGFDLVLQRAVAGLPLMPADLNGMGVGGLLR